MTRLFTLLLFAALAVDDQRPTEPSTSDQHREKAERAEPQPADDWRIWQLPITEAIRAALEADGRTRVVYWEPVPLCDCFSPAPTKRRPSSVPGTAPYVIAPIDRDVSIWQFKANATEIARSVEAPYRRLAERHVRAWACEKAVELATPVFEREESARNAPGKLSPAQLDDLFETEREFRQLEDDEKAALIEILTAERKLRDVLQLQVPQNYRVVPVSGPDEHRGERDWDRCRSTTEVSRPDLVLARAGIRTAQARKFGAEVLEFAAIRLPVLDLDAASRRSRAALNNLRQAEARLRQTDLRAQLHLSRGITQFDATLASLDAAREARLAAQERMDEQRALYEECEIKAVRYFDAIREFVAAVALEARCSAEHNIALVDLEATMGTLLRFREIDVVPGRPPEDLAKE
jgi:hypothetical protein